MRHLASLLTITTLTLSLTSCVIVNKPAVGEVVERTITITETPEALAIQGGADVIVDSTLPEGEIRVKTHTDIFDILDICVEDGSLNIRQKSYDLRAETLEVRIPHYDYSVIATSGGSDFKWDNCNVESLVIASSGGADIEISGHCKQLTVAASGGADLDLEELIAECVEVSISGGADAGVHATNSLTINASGGADIYYTGNPSTTDINTSGGASVSRND